MLLLMSGTAKFSSRAETTNAPAQLDYAAFRMISDRNIFNPNRRPGTAARAVTRPAAAAQVEAISLVGIMAYEKGTFAFFDGTQPDYQQVLPSGTNIGEYHIAQITPDRVRLTQGTNVYDLKVGMEMRREDEGSWFLTDSSEPPKRRVAGGRVWNRGGATGAGKTGEENPEGEGGPEVIVVTGNENGFNGEGAPEGEPQVEADAPPTDPVLLRLLQRRQEMSR
ncbi:MAG TPA: hypothetical protein PKO21_06295 [Verrucomicrobiota bacterium]|nr:hypothetical protein [Verrucomicrobiota bacterium]